MMKYEFVTRSIPTLWKNIEGVLLVSSTGFAPGSIYGSTFWLGTMLPTAFMEFWNILVRDLRTD